MHAEEAYITQSVQAGARGYLLKDSAASDLVRGVEAVAAGKSFFSPAVAQVLSNTYAREREAHHVDDRYELLTERERQIYQLLAEGNSNKEVAARLGVSLHTVETHRTRIMDKLDVHNAAELVLSAVRRGLVV